MVNIKNTTVTKENVVAAFKVLVDNGIEPDEAGTVLQSLGYALVDTELEPVIEEALS